MSLYAVEFAADTQHPNVTLSQSDDVKDTTVKGGKTFPSDDRMRDYIKWIKVFRWESPRITLDHTFFFSSKKRLKGTHEEMSRDFSTPTPINRTSGSGKIWDGDHGPWCLMMWEWGLRKKIDREAEMHAGIELIVLVVNWMFFLLFFPIKQPSSHLTAIHMWNISTSSTSTKHLKQKLSTFICVTVSLCIGAVILVTNFGTSWHSATASISSPYRAFSKDKIQAELGVRVGLLSVNITLKALSSSSSSTQSIFHNSKYLNQQLNHHHHHLHDNPHNHHHHHYSLSDINFNERFYWIGR